MNKTTRDITLQALIACAYVVLLFTFQFMSFTEVQFRIAEFLLILILFSKKHAFGILIGTFIGNFMLSPYGIIDAGFGTLATLVGIGWMLLFRKIWPLALFGPVIANAIIVPIYVIYFFFGLEIGLFEIFTHATYYIFAGWVALGQFAVMYGIGLPVYLILRKKPEIVEYLM